MTPPEDLDKDTVPENYERATGKGDLRIGGAGTIGIAVLLVSLTVLFATSIFAFLLVRFREPVWPPPGFPPIPRTLWLSTIVILASSVTIQRAANAIKRDNQRTLLRMLWATFALGLLFLALQTLNWIEFYDRLAPSTQVRGSYLGMFYVLTGLHAAHVIGGLIPLAVVIHVARRGKYSRNYFPGVRYSTAYWHFLDIVWIILFCVLYF
ncbi:MAG TPA: cytochrome c oxidase subunit 3 [Phycisphaerae bacterium]|nr:cytochrome c oxidase subunit 3 [Phycisphaerae bacterium]